MANTQAIYNVTINCQRGISYKTSPWDFCESFPFKESLLCFVVCVLMDLKRCGSERERKGRDEQGITKW